MSDDLDSAADTCSTPGCSRRTWRGLDECYACAHGLYPEPRKPDPEQQRRIGETTVAYLRRQAARERNPQTRLAIEARVRAWEKEQEQRRDLCREQTARVATAARGSK